MEIEGALGGEVHSLTFNIQQEPRKLKPSDGANMQLRGLTENPCIYI